MPDRKLLHLVLLVVVIVVVPAVGLPHSPLLVSINARVSRWFQPRFKRQAAVINPTTVAGTSLSTAKQAWDLFNNDSSKAKIELILYNFSKWLFKKLFVREIHGQLADVPNFIAAGMHESFVAYQTGYQSSTAGIIELSSLNKRYCLIYWYVEGEQHMYRYSNRLGINCFDNKTIATGYIDEIKTAAKHLKLDEKHRNPKVDEYFKGKWTYVTDTVSSLTHCEADYCIQGTMATGLKAIARISIYPKSLNDWQDNKTIDQISVDYLCNTDEQEPLNTNGSRRKLVAQVVWTWFGGGAVGFILLVSGTVLASMACCCKDKLCSCCKKDEPETKAKVDIIIQGTGTNDINLKATSTDDIEMETKRIG